MLIDVAIPGDRNVIKKEAENILKYTDLIIEIQTKLIPGGQLEPFQNHSDNT